MSESKCFWCKGTGKIKVPNNQEDYNYYYDKWFDGGQFSGIMCEKMALDKVGFTIQNCSHCNKQD